MVHGVPEEAELSEVVLSDGVSFTVAVSAGRYGSGYGMNSVLMMHSEKPIIPETSWLRKGLEGV